jgi:hypothetical protein
MSVIGWLRWGGGLPAYLRRVGRWFPEQFHKPTFRFSSPRHVQLSTIKVDMLGYLDESMINPLDPIPVSTTSFLFNSFCAR